MKENQQKSVSIEAGDTTNTNNQIVNISVDKLKPHKVFYKGIRDKKKFEVFVDSIKRIGISQPLLIRQYDGGYEIGIGHHRWEAAKLLGMKKVPALIKNNVDDGEWAEICVWDNLMRMDYSPIQKEEQIYLLYHDGLASGRYKSYRDLARKGEYSDVWVGNLIKAYEWRMKIEEKCKVTLHDTISSQNILDATVLLKNRKDEKSALNDMSQLLNLVMLKEYKSSQIKEMAQTLRDWSKKLREQVLYEYKNYRYGTIKNQLEKQVNESTPKPKKKTTFRENVVNKNLVIDTYNAVGNFEALITNIESNNEKQKSIRYIKVTMALLGDVLFSTGELTKKQKKTIKEDILGIKIPANNYDGNPDLQGLAKFYDAENDVEEQQNETNLPSAKESNQSLSNNNMEKSGVTSNNNTPEPEVK